MTLPKFMKTVIVTGGRNYSNKSKVWGVLDFLEADIIVEGGCPTGADSHARAYVGYTQVRRKLTGITIPADWNKFGRSAGPRRNKEMVEKYPHAVVVAFSGGDGTANCVKLAKERDMVVLLVDE